MDSMESARELLELRKLQALLRESRALKVFEIRNLRAELRETQTGLAPSNRKPAVYTPEN